MDNETSIKMQLLIRDARLAYFAFHNKTTDACRLVIVDDASTPAIEGFLNAGWDRIGVVALMRKEYGGKPSIQYELVPGVSEGTGERVKQVFTDMLLASGDLELDGPVN
jgi:hypothetical protein